MFLIGTFMLSFKLVIQKQKKSYNFINFFEPIGKRGSGERMEKT